MHLNKLRDIKRIKMDRFKFSSVGEDDETSDEDTPATTLMLEE